MTALGAPLKGQATIAIVSPKYTPGSGGIRALFALAATLKARGFRATLLVPEVPPGLPAGFPVMTFGESAGRSFDICVYPEVATGNPVGARHVVRFLLSNPKVTCPKTLATYGPEDFYIHFDGDHVPPGRQSQDLYTPLADRRFYHRRGEAVHREGYVICTKRPPATPWKIPSWCSPLHLVTPNKPRSHAELGDTYRSVKAMIAFDRSTAVYEALVCGCPVICVASGLFQPGTFQPRFEGAGLTWDFSPEGILEANKTVDRFNDIYAAIERAYPARAETVFLNILREAAARDAMTI